MKKRISFSRKQLAIPYGIFLLLFVVFPLILIFVYAFTDAAGNFTFDNFTKFFTSSSTIAALINSLIVGILTTVLCLLIGYPIAYFLANKKYNRSKVLMILFIMPMWINFVLRTLATRELLTLMGLNGGEHPFVSTMIGMVYNYLPFMILPLYNVLEKMDENVLNAASDLGANNRDVFTRVIIPMSRPGIVSGITMVFMPTMSSYVISDLLGERKIQLLGNLIQFNFDYSNWNYGSAIAFLMLIIIGITTLITSANETDNPRGGALW